MKKGLAAVAAASVMLLAACGGDSGRPSVDEIRDGLQSVAEQQLGSLGADAEFSDEFLQCWAEAAHASDASDEALRAVADGDTGYQGSSEDANALSSSVMDCTDLLIP